MMDSRSANLHAALKRVCERYLIDDILPERRAMEALCFTWLQAYRPIVRGPKSKMRAAIEWIEIFQARAKRRGIDPATTLIEDRRVSAAIFRLRYAKLAEAHAHSRRKKAKGIP